MKNIHIDYQGSAPDFKRASQMAKDIASQQSHMQEPTIMSWHQHSNQHLSPYYEGANPDSWCEKYGEGNGGKVEVSVGDEYDFVMMDAQGFETVGDLPLRNLSDDSGNQYLCFTPILGRQSKKPTAEACTYLDEWTADQF